ncbi:MAG TPA: hypothetical protein VFO85_10710, partial [Vicinamibacteria bacterium]|nr:hypothetical protein [Vicinamibacteria bacterium]
MHGSLFLWAPVALGLMAPALPRLHADGVAMRATLRRAQRVEISWSRGGLGQPLARTYQLAVQGGRIVGGNVPMPLYKRFLKILGQAPLVPGPYVPWITHTDDDPSISIRVTAGGRSVRFFTRSQGPGHDPWGVEVAGHTHIVPSDAPQRALDVLIPALEAPAEAARMVTPPSLPPLPPSERLRKAIVGNDVETVRRLLAAG